MGPYMAGRVLHALPLLLSLPVSRATPGLGSSQTDDGPAHQNRCCQAGLPALRTLLATQVYPDDVAAVLVEPVLGEGGYVVPPRRLPARPARPLRRVRHPAHRRRGAEWLRAHRQPCSPSSSLA